MEWEMIPNENNLVNNEVNSPHNRDNIMQTAWEEKNCFSCAKTIEGDEANWQVCDCLVVFCKSDACAKQFALHQANCEQVGAASDLNKNAKEESANEEDGVIKSDDENDDDDDDVDDEIMLKNMRAFALNSGANAAKLNLNNNGSGGGTSKMKPKTVAPAHPHVAIKEKEYREEIKRAKKREGVLANKKRTELSLKSLEALDASFDKNLSVEEEAARRKNVESLLIGEEEIILKPSPPSSSSSSSSVEKAPIAAAATPQLSNEQKKQRFDVCMKQAIFEMKGGDKHKAVDLLRAATEVAFTPAMAVTSRSVLGKCFVELNQLRNAIPELLFAVNNAGEAKLSEATVVQLKRELKLVYLDLGDLESARYVSVVYDGGAGEENTLDNIPDALKNSMKLAMEKCVKQKDFLDLEVLINAFAGAHHKSILNYPHPITGMTPLMICCAKNQIGLVKTIVSSFKNPAFLFEASDVSGASCLLHAARSGSGAVLQYLLREVKIGFPPDLQEEEIKKWPPATMDVIKSLLSSN